MMGIIELKAIKLEQRITLFFGLLQTRGNNRIFKRIMNEVWWQTLGVYYVSYNKLQRDIERNF